MAWIFLLVAGLAEIGWPLGLETFTNNKPQDRLDTCGGSVNEF